MESPSEFFRFVYISSPCPNITDVHRVAIKLVKAIITTNFIAVEYPYARPILIVYRPVTITITMLTKSARSNIDLINILFVF